MQKALHIEEAFHLPMGGKSAGVPCAGRKLYLRRSEPMHRHVREDKRGFIKKAHSNLRFPWEVDLRHI